MKSLQMLWEARMEKYSHISARQERERGEVISALMTKTTFTDEELVQILYAIDFLWGIHNKDQFTGLALAHLRDSYLRIARARGIETE